MVFQLLHIVIVSFSAFSVIQFINDLQVSPNNLCDKLLLDTVWLYPSPGFSWISLNGCFVGCFGLYNHQWKIFALSDFGHISSVGAVCCEDRFHTTKKGGMGEVGGHVHKMPHTWWLLLLAVEQPWLALAGPFYTLLTQRGTEATPLLL